MRKSLGAIAATALIACPGCGSGSAAPNAAKPTPLAVVAEHTRAVESAVDTAAATPSAEPAPAPEPPPSVRYEPPFPDRQDPFKAPQTSSRTARRTEGASSSSVELLGFANVGEPSAVLSIDGEVQLIAQGASSKGVDVLQITPPRAVLKRGRTRWTATIE